MWPTEPTVAEARRIKSIINRHSLRTGIVYGARTEHDDADILCRWIDFSLALECKVLIWVGIGGYHRFPSDPRSPQEMTSLHRAFVEKIRRVGEVAASRGVTITLKPHTGNTATGYADFPAAGEGEVDFGRILKRLAAVGFDGPLVVERVDGSDGGALTAEQIDARLVRARANVTATAKAAGMVLH